jgi:drug/metabolite transporter (DMT)-like permease
VTEQLGALAAVGTSICFSIGSTLFAFSARELGSPLVNRVRLALALSILMPLHWLTFGSLLPVQADASHWGWLALSGIVGLVLGDVALFQAFVMIGPRLSMLMMALAPVLSVVLAWLFLGEILDFQELLGIAITVGGIVWVIAERQNGTLADGAQSAHDRRRYLTGLMWGLGGAAGQAGGLVLSKLGLADQFPALSGNVIRMVAAAGAIWLITALSGKVVSSIQTAKAHPRALKYIAAATMLGPVTGVFLSLVAVQNAPVGIAATLSSLTPIFMLPIAHFAYKEHVSRQAIVGTAIAFVGIAILFLKVG